MKNEIGGVCGTCGRQKGFCRAIPEGKRAGVIIPRILKLVIYIYIYIYIYISRQSAQEGGKVVSPTHRPPFPPRKYTWYSFLLEAESTPRP